MMSSLRTTLFAAASTASAVCVFTLGVIFLPQPQQLLVAATPVVAASARERLFATAQLQRYFRTRDTTLISSYNPDERAHLNEVTTIIGTVPWLFFVSALAAFALGLQGYRAHGKPWLRHALRSACQASLAVTLGFLVLGSLTFAAAFQWFHQLAFVQAPWAFDPAESKLVVLFPPQYFQAATTFVLLGTAAAATMGWLLIAREATKNPRG
ncbi:MAG: DUF1461 domain-containing protein [bacterium]|nr:DUF1461 domain-containing protein [bacterium]